MPVTHSPTLAGKALQPQMPHPGGSVMLPAYVVAAVVFGLHLLTNGVWDFHRDELLYLELGRHLDLGYWSNPPLIGLLGWIGGLLPGSGAWSVRLIPAALSSILVVVMGLMARELGGGRTAITLSSLCALLSPALVRVGVLFQPVIVDVLVWSLCFYLILKYLNTAQDRWLLWLGVTIGVGMLNKYSIAFLVLGSIAGLLMTRHRSLFRRKAFYLSIALAFLIVLPNLIWQAWHGFPVVTHMETLRATQLVYVRPADFLVEQFLHHIPVVWVWIVGLYFVFASRSLRLIGWTFVAVLGLLMALGGKSYYTLGLYPVLLAAGARWLELHTGRTVQTVAFSAAAVAALLISPLSLPYLSPPQMVGYGRTFVDVTGVDAPFRWEDGEAHALPQDYADMLGWPELAGLVEAAYRSGPNGKTVIYAENYGQAGAISQYRPQLPRPFSFSDSYRLWLSRHLPRGTEALVYVNDELGEDVRSLFGSIREVGRIEMPFARERGTSVYLMQSPRSDLNRFWTQRVDEVMGPP